MKFTELDTPVMLIDRDILHANCKRMQDYADEQHVALRPHTKTHKAPYLAKFQRELGAKGITVAKVGEAEVMAAHGLDDIFIANEPVGAIKLQRIRNLAEIIDISFGVDCPEHIEAADRVFEGAAKHAKVVVEIEVGENRSGIITDDQFMAVLEALKNAKNVDFLGIFSHEGHCYNADNIDDCHEKFIASQKRTLHYAELAKENGLPCARVSIGSTPSLLYHFDLLPGITEFRPGTYPLMDASMANVLGDLGDCAATVLATVMSKPTDERVILDVGAKGITAQTRTVGITKCEGHGTILEYPETHIFDVYDEHAIIYDRAFHDAVKIGDKVRIIPVHICPAANLYDKAYLTSGDEVVGEYEVACRGKLQ